MCRLRRTGSPADAGLPGFHGWAYWGAGSHPRHSGLVDLESLPYVDQARVLDRLLVELVQALPSALHVIPLGDLAKRVTTPNVNGLAASTVLLVSRLLCDLLLRVARLLGFGAPGIGRRRCMPIRLAVRLGQTRTSAAGRPGTRALACQHSTGDRDLLGFGCQMCLAC